MLPPALKLRLYVLAYKLFFASIYTWIYSCPSLLQCSSISSLCPFFLLNCRVMLLDISPHLNDAAAAIVDDSFLRCFQQATSDPWNWNIYLFPVWCLGVLVRYLILFPIRSGPSSFRPKWKPVPYITWTSDLKVPCCSGSNTPSGRALKIFLREYKDP